MMININDIKNGMTIIFKDVYTSISPYSAVERSAVYKGSKRKLTTWVDILATTKIPVFFNNSFVRDINPPDFSPLYFYKNLW